MLRIVCMLSVALLLALMVAGCTDTSVDVSGDGSQVAVNHNGTLWVADVEKEDWRKVPLEGGSATSPTWSPDGRYVLFQLQPPAQQTAPSDKTAATTGAEPVQQESAYAALFDTNTGGITPLAKDVEPPFAWDADSNGFVALQQDQDERKIAWFGTDGVVIRTVPLPKDDINILRLVWLPGSHDIAFIALHGKENLQSQDVFRTEDSHVQRISEAGDVVGIGSDSAHKRLLWAKSWSSSLGLQMMLFSYNPASKQITRLHFPEILSFVLPEPGFNSSVDSVIFSSNAQRMAVLVQAVKEPVPNEEVTHTRTACYTVETDASGGHLIQKSELDGNLYPAWSHDGRRLVILDSSIEPPQLAVYNYDGTGKRMAP